MRSVLVLTVSFLAALVVACGGASSDSASDHSGSGSTPQASAPAITTQPVNQSVDPGGQATFSVSATGSGLSYQWKRNGSPITGANSSSYTTPAISSRDDGARFTVVITNAAGSVTSRDAMLMVTAGSVPGGTSGTDVVTY